MRFFFYGTLLAASGTGVSRALHAKLRPLGGARMRGRLYAVPDPRGWYPALLPGRGAVCGELYEALPGFGRDDLARIDAYEDCDPARPGLSLYRRVVLPFQAGTGGTGEAWTYRFNRALPPGSRRIARGDFPAWLAHLGRTAFGG